MSLSTISARIDSYDKYAFDSFCARAGLNASTAINLFVKKVIRDNRIPFEISAPAVGSDAEALSSFYKMREYAKEEGLQDMTIDEINAEIADCRRECL